MSRITLRAFTAFPWSSAYFAPTDHSERFNRRLAALKHAREIVTKGFRTPAAEFFAKLMPEALGARMENSLLIPIPGHAAAPPDPQSNTAQFAIALAQRFPKTRVHHCLERLVTVPRSSKVAPSQRPTVERHFKSLKCHAFPTAKRIVLVDDIVTKGSISVAVARKLQDGGFKGEILVVAGGYTRTKWVGSDQTTYLELKIDWMGAEHPSTTEVASF